MNEQELRNAWRRAFDGAGDDPPAALEARLTEAFRSEQRRRQAHRRAWLWRSAAAMAAAVLLAAISFIEWRSNRRPAPAPARVAHTVLPSHERERVVAQVVTPAHQPVRHVRARRHRRPPTAQPVTPQTELAGGFVSLTDDPQPLSSGEVVRIEMPAGALSGIGFTVAASRAAMPVTADVLLDQDGTARAIRLVSAGSSFQ